MSAPVPASNGTAQTAVAPASVSVRNVRVTAGRGGGGRDRWDDDLLERA